jgi:hypothetical protein
VCFGRILVDLLEIEQAFVWCYYLLIEPNDSANSPRQAADKLFWLRSDIQVSGLWQDRWVLRREVKGGTVDADVRVGWVSTVGIGDQSWYIIANAGEVNTERMD